MLNEMFHFTHFSGFNLYRIKFLTAILSAATVDVNYEFRDKTYAYS